MSASVAPGVSERPRTGGDFPRLSGVHVLVVEADTRAANVLATVLEYCGVWVSTVEGPEAARRLFDNVMPHVLVVGTSADDRAAYDFIAWVRARTPRQGGRVPAIALSADGGQARALAAGFQEWMPTPVDLRALCRVVGRLGRPEALSPDGA